MKRIWLCLALLLLCAFVLTGCGAVEETTAMTGTADSAVKKELAASPTFAEALDENGFMTKIREDSFVELLGNFRYDGKLLSESGVESDSNHGISCASLRMDDVVKAEYTLEYIGNRTVENYYTRIMAWKPIEGLVMPYGITFDTTVFDLLKIIGCKIDLPSEFVSNVKYQSYAMTLDFDDMPDDGSTLVLYDYARVPDDGVWYYDEGVRYSLVYSIPLVFDYSEPVESKSASRKIVLDFDKKTDKLCRVSFALWESIEYADKTLTTSPTFADSLEDNGFAGEISRDEVDERLAQWTYNGKTLNSYAQVMMGDGLFGGTTIYSGDDIFHWTIDFAWNVDRSFADYTHTFCMKEPIRGVVMPYGIGFDNSLDDLIKVLEVEVDFSSNQEQLLEHTLIPDYESKLLLTAERTLVFNEYTECVRSLSNGDDLYVLVTRSVVLDFDSETNRLRDVTFELKERRVYNEDALLDPQTFSHALDRNGFLSGETRYNFDLLLYYCSNENKILSRYIGKTFSDEYGYTVSVETNDIFSGSNTYHAAGERNNEQYDMTLTFYCPVEGLTIPYGLSFGDTLDSVLKTVSCSADPWVVGENAWTMLLSRKKEDGVESTLKLIDYSRMPDSTSRDLAIVFTEICQATHKDGQTFDVTRSVRLGFGAETGMMAITFSILEVAVTTE